MKDDLIFHVVKKEDWKTQKKDSRYHPETIDTEGFIHCSTGRNIEEVTNRLYSGEDDILLIIINTTLVDPEIRYENCGNSDIKYPHIYGPLNMDAVIDKIELASEDDGSYKISFSEN
ncbi:DUF952 domain-containing protein [Balneolaceae bacterium YR4-1]|uniref:DUF952 domain-containing protein n=1 Tax=Halalkalibaculum roseum TaxID=2709311 RepID=A0A6M1T0X2_9BACT|nr:DUF952 domain-containing protein [Halalkalibaculum roseum]NGP76397.1 DUF952 domain-containing protein [Halalkalibaculum roseum]